MIEVGLHALGIGSGARREVIDAVASAAETAGFATLWAGEHVVLVDEGRSRYPYADDGRIAVPSDADWLDPLVALSFAAAATTRIRLATGVLLIPEHNPVHLAKQTASLDRLCGGRLTLGAGVGWSREEFAALGVPFERRGARTRDYIAAMRTIWRDDPATHHGEFAAFDRVRVNPKPVHGRIPVVFGGNSDAALRRVGGYGEGWYGFNLAGVEAAAERVAFARARARDAGRDPEALAFAVALTDPRPSDVPALERAGVTELVLVESPPEDAAEAASWVDRLADRWLGPRGGPKRAASGA